MGLREIFTEIYSRDVWRGEESRSGKGSDSKRTETLKVDLVGLIREYDIGYVVDASCGDFNWMKDVVRTSGVRYLGLDIVEPLIGKNNEVYASESVKFRVCDITVGPLPGGDLVLCRDVLVHLSYAHIRDFLSNFANSSSTYLLATTFNRENRVNSELVEGVRSWRSLNLERPPFNFPPPEWLIQETNVEHPAFLDKCLGLWGSPVVRSVVEGMKV